MSFILFLYVSETGSRSCNYCVKCFYHSINSHPRCSNCSSCNILGFQVLFKYLWERKSGSYHNQITFVMCQEFYMIFLNCQRLSLINLFIKEYVMQLFKSPHPSINPRKRPAFFFSLQILVYGQRWYSNLIGDFSTVITSRNLLQGHGSSDM